MANTLRCFREEHSKEKMKDDNVSTVTAVEQKTVEQNVEEAYDAFRIDRSMLQPVLQREKHFQYLKKGLRHLSESYSCLDASRPWLCYWILHSLELLGEPIDDRMASDICQFLTRCQSPNGGFGGGPGQEPHLAPTYAAVNALCIIGTEEAYNVINREKLLKFLHSVKQPNGSFTMHVCGEVDVRSTYCAASVASLTNIITPTLFEGTPEWVLRCQNWEGGIGGVPGMEAHGGYTFCGMAAMVILKKEWMLDLKTLLRWVTSRQMRFEGGFQGRCNKLVDGCYSFWQAGLLPLLHRALHIDGKDSLSMTHWMFHQEALQEYILLCCQNSTGGLLDKPGKSRDFYHTCYCLSGLSVAQHFGGGDLLHKVIVGDENNRLEPIHPVYNIGPENVARAIMHFFKLPVPQMKNSSN
ncbi:protein farnesyltransferase subunit beta isoform X1 [Scyliorhinus canicula]|uniref:protein farnesyltransferase subunit beta isoform X1 n=2 Tax=Scyliorhinus canicula TaxID=7830 RepID=UPI0018F31EE7|nr:protein farnesyltransferase subunit beta isoform X1 [Scyliorhinus canicula]